ncbi:plasminogen-like [Oppia nitens]|uniref:plasminogen-like n=1 Tax=Oppia nitens TaxID=1686743 RepID=UPI0023DC6D7F|nr:plasminogen-like [Oppia nitens]
MLESISILTPYPNIVVISIGVVQCLHSLTDQTLSERNARHVWYRTAVTVDYKKLFQVVIKCDYKCTKRTVSSTGRVAMDFQDSNDKSHIYGVNQWFRHPLYTDKLKKYLDIALLKLDSHIPITHTAGYYTVNSICLTDKNIVNIDDELALFAGFGYIDRGVSNPGPLRTGWLKLMKTFGNITDIFGARIIAFRYPNNGGMATCKGDSGGPLIQNVLDSDSSDGQNRAVLIGVISSSVGNKAIGYCHNPDPNTKMVFIRVSKFIEWIVETVLSNTN